MRQLCQSLIDRLPALNHIDLERVVIAFAQARKPVPYGIQASLTPMRFEGGKRFTTQRGRKMTVQKLVDRQGREMLYVLSFYLPRFQEQEFREKLITTVHELWHISPEFNGDIRRFPGRCFAHSTSQADYDAEMEEMVDEWLTTDPPSHLYEFLYHSFDDLNRLYGPIVGQKVARPKVIPA